MSARIALLSVDAGRSDTNSLWPHYGLVLIGTLLKQAGHTVQVFDQSFLGDNDAEFGNRISDFKPDVVGLSLYTTHITRGLDRARNIRAHLPGTPLIAGGPHVSLYAEDLWKTGLFTAALRGEAESAIVELLEQVLEGNQPGIVDGSPTKGDAIPAADFSIASRYDTMRWLPIQLSRGCPFNCSFCEVRNIASRAIRYRAVSVCLDEIQTALTRLPHVHTVRVVDDCPTLDVERFKGFLRDYSRLIPVRISIDNMRADCLDGELLDLLKQCRVPYVCVAAESGSPEVFKHIDKGESLDQIAHAARLVREKKIPLYMCFVIGLPHATFETEMESLRLARQLKPDLTYWNMFLPHRGSRARAWFEEHGTIYDEADRLSVPSYDLTFSPPTCETPEFTREQRVRAYLTCVLETVSFVFTPRALLRAFMLAHRYHLWASTPVMLLRIPAKAMAYAKLALDRLAARGRRV
jgi:radical SAM superfamily enzyme YgiQ (UPF0313 family)